MSVVCLAHCAIQGDHLSGNPGNVREFDSCQGNVKDYTKSQGNVREKILSGKSCLKLFIVSAYIYGFGSCTVAFLPHC